VGAKWTAARVNGELESSWPRASSILKYDLAIQRLLRLPALSEAEASLLRRLQAEIFAAILPPILISNIATAILVAAIASWHGWASVLIPWAIATSLISWVGLHKLRQAKLRPQREHPSERFTRRTIIDSGLLACPWLFVAIVLNHQTAPQIEVLIATILSGLIFASIFTMSSMPAAALTFSGIVMVARVLQVLFMPLDQALSNVLLLLVYTAILITTLKVFALLYIDRVRSSAVTRHLRGDAQARAEREESRREQTEAHACGFRDEVGNIMQSLTSSAERLSSASESLRSIATTSHDALSGAVARVGSAATNMASVESCSRELSENVDLIRREASATASVFQIAATDIAATIAIKGDLAQAVGEIGQVSNVIREIAGQTNLLALNATIEAARAGAAGRGFAVVAAEVKALAARTGVATEEIAARIEQIRSATDRSLISLMNLDRSGTAILAATAGIDASVERQVRAITTIAGLLSRALAETEQANAAIGSVTRNAASTLERSEDIAEAAQAIGDEAKQLGTSVARFSHRITQ
jgi:methyl-accepting chemotaxis protein